MSKSAILGPPFDPYMRKRGGGGGGGGGGDLSCFEDNRGWGGHMNLKLSGWYLINQSIFIRSLPKCNHFAFLIVLACV